MEFSTAGIKTLSCRSKPSPIIARANPNTLAAPPMSFFIRPIEFPGLRFRPPVSKHTPLPTKVSFGPLLPIFKSISLGVFSDAAPTACIIGKFCSSNLSPNTTSIFALNSWANSFADLSSSAGPKSLAGVFIRSRAKNSPAKIASIQLVSKLIGFTSSAIPLSDLRLYFLNSYCDISQPKTSSFGLANGISPIIL